MCKGCCLQSASCASGKNSCPARENQGNTNGRHSQSLARSKHSRLSLFECLCCKLGFFFDRHLVMRNQHGKDGYAFSFEKLSANARARSGAERHESITRPIFEETVWFKCVGVFPIPGIIVQPRSSNCYISPLWNWYEDLLALAITDYKAGIFSRDFGNARYRREHSQSLVEYSSRVC